MEKSHLSHIYELCPLTELGVNHAKRNAAANHSTSPYDAEATPSVFNDQIKIIGSPIIAATTTLTMSTVMILSILHNYYKLF